MAAPPRRVKGRKRIRRGPGQQIIGDRDFRLADEVRYIQRQAAHQQGRFLTVGQLILFATETGDAWLLDPADRLAARLARDGDSEPIHIEETDTTLAIGSKGRYRIDGPAFVYADNDSGRVTTVLGYPTDQLAQIGWLGNFKYFWLVLRDLVLYLPDGREIVYVNQLTIEVGATTLVAGPSGSGKSTLFRAISGIWPYGRGTIERPAGATIMLLPQRPYV